MQGDWAGSSCYHISHPLAAQCSDDQTQTPSCGLQGPSWFGLCLPVWPQLRTPPPNSPHLCQTVLFSPGQEIGQVPSSPRAL